ncbi:hypothetical protein K504DRAFT_375054 [Pleomassaria siparia CBS 279.74]|uniref:Helicase C-terminal domain-containing protein n=1 Tax=Pleomassaria siparia CBS 279.74 TaxID=1314801 RepID=A0A6G1KGW7_9PLEO|nr:hypothetical protein K504DRAFT_375054 [Pleomassaria siparia CBS 279.74]
MLIDEDEVDETVISQSNKNPQNKTKSSRPSVRGNYANNDINLDLPPISNIEDLMEVIIDKALGLGFKEAVNDLRKGGVYPLKVATLFSGTESPLIALQLNSQTLEKKGLPPIEIDHLFSTEIDSGKQAYIERNFHPKILFRDARDFIPKNDKPPVTATTAYGAEVEIPRVIDLLIAGFVCKDLSSLNAKKKTLMDGGESSDTWRALFNFAKEFRPSVILIENVKSKGETWKDIQKKLLSIDYESQWHIVDTKHYGLPQTRQRMYMVAVNKQLHDSGAKAAALGWKETMQKLQRQCSSPFEAWLPKEISRQQNYTNLVSETDWVLSKLRYELMRLIDRLGTKHPISQYNDNGSSCPPDFANRKFYFSQSSRVYDCFDIAHLQGALAGHDSLHKMAVWDVSQNADRFRAKLGLVPAITPSGCDFISNQQTALTGPQLLVLQGMPFDKLLLGNETWKELQDLAGNAMSVPVIGASIISALIHCRKGFHKKSKQLTSNPDARLNQKTILVTPENMGHQTLKSSEFEELDISQLIRDAASSARLCACEGVKDISKSPVQVCKDCGHTACAGCAGNPLHVYHSAISRHDRLFPTDFIQKWRPQLPARVTFTDFPSLLEVQTGSDTDASNFAERVDEVDLNSQCFSISNFARSENIWKVLYVSDEATLELQIEKTVEWKLYIKCPRSLPANSSLRKTLEQPVARGLVKSSLLEPTWGVLNTQTDSCQLLILGSAETTAAWRNRLGLLDYVNETVPMEIDITSNDAREFVQELIGHYTLLPDCGTAMCSLYKKSCDPPLYFFLDSDAIGHGDLDSFVFSHDLRRMPYGSSRISHARLDCSWRPWSGKCDGKTPIKTTFTAQWTASDIRLNANVPDVHVRIPSAKSAISESALHGCSHAVTVLNVQTKAVTDTEEFSAFSWALEKAKLLPSFPDWHTFPVASTTDNCTCAPPLPDILWSVNDNFEATAREERKSAAEVERAVQTRPHVYNIDTSINSAVAELNVAVNVSVLRHCARSRLLNTEVDCNEAWRLLTDHVEPASKSFPQLLLGSNAQDNIHPGPRKMQLELTDTQKRSLTWMEKQELGVSMTIEEIEEAIQHDLGWRLEVRASTTATLRGGVLADLPSFGKTVTTIALIQTEFEKKTPVAILEDNCQLSSGLPNLVDVAATLIVCPEHIAKQWREEFERFLDEDQFEQYNILLITRYSDLERLSIADVQNARLIIVAWKVFANGSYVSDLARFAALPEPATMKGRAYEAWLDYATKVIPTRLKELQDTGVVEFNKNTHKTLEERLANPDFQAVVPVKIGHGSAYQTYDPADSTTWGKRTARPAPKVTIKKARSEHTTRATEADADWTTYPTPLLQLFRFNRVVVDEYHYLYTELDASHAAVKKINAHKRWILSGTPALTNFTDVNQMAMLLGVRLGRDVWDSTNFTPIEKRLASEQTEVERFLSRTQIMSYQWHEARHNRAQGFLNTFARQNAPSLEHIECTEILRPVELGVAHYAVYLELSQHLSSLRMQIKKQKPAKRSKSDAKAHDSLRNVRFEKSLRNSETAEQALVHAALEFTTSAGESKLPTLVAQRQAQIEETKREVFNALIHANMAQNQLIKRFNVHESTYKNLKQLLKEKRGLGDDDAAIAVLKLLRQAEGKGKETSNLADKNKGVAHLKLLTQNLYAAAQELTSRMRSYRFLNSIQQFIATLSNDNTSSEDIACSSPTCAATSQSLILVDNCGHLVCEACLGKRLDRESCVHKGCSVPVQASNLIRLSELGLENTVSLDVSFGRKLDDICELIKRMPKEDQCILFVPSENATDTLEEVFAHHGISHHQRAALMPETIHDFQTNQDPEKKKKVLILPLGGVEASGVNLTNANHIIFLSPHLAESQYEYDSQMAQAVARSRRFGQKKKVFIYHCAALRTIDVDIMEKRHKRVDAIEEAAGSPIQTPDTISNKREKTKLIRKTSGRMALVPVSWVTDEEKRAKLGVEENQKFTSLITFSDRYQYDEE